MGALGSFILVSGVVLFLVCVQAAAIYVGCRIAKIPQADFIGSLMITVKCWLFGVLALPLFMLPLVGALINIIAHFLIPTLVIKKEYNVDMDKAFWAAFGYLASFILAVVGVVVYFKLTEAG